MNKPLALVNQALAIAPYDPRAHLAAAYLELRLAAKTATAVEFMSGSESINGVGPSGLAGYFNVNQVSGSAGIIRRASG